MNCTSRMRLCGATRSATQLMSACKRAARRRTYSVTVTSGIVTAGLSLLMIIALPHLGLAASSGSARYGTARHGTAADDVNGRGSCYEFVSRRFARDRDLNG